MTQHIEEARKLAYDYAYRHLEDDAEKAIAAALAAAEERGRIEERELCNQIVRAAWGQNVTIEVLSDAITKEPTP
ncbi:MAG: hypothetical protein H5U22_06725 [Rhizobium sp.]|nr:hypothetical protein [Rhizobium sp.]